MKKTIIASLVALMAFAGAEAVSYAADSQANVPGVFDKKKKETKTVTLSANIHCKNCKAKVENNIAFEKGVLGLKVSVEDKTVVITYDPSKTDLEKLLAAMKKLGYPATVVA